MTTSTLLRESCGPSVRRTWKRLCGVDQERQISMVMIIDAMQAASNPLDSPVLLLHCCTDSERARRVAKHFALQCATRVERHFDDRYPDDGRVRESNDVVSRHLLGDAGKEDVWKAMNAASVAARDAALRSFPVVADTAWAAAAAAVDAAYTAMRDDTKDAVWAAWATAEAAVTAAGPSEQAWQRTQLRTLVAQE